MQAQATVPDAARAWAAFVLMVLVFALFTVDRSLQVFLRSTVARAQVFERPLGIRLTGLIHDVAQRSHVATWAAWLYTLFMIGALVPVLGPAATWVVVVGAVLDLTFIVGIWLYRFLTSAEFQGAGR